MSTLKRLLGELTPEKLNEMKEKRLKEKREKTLDFQLGYFVGEYIVNKKLPTLSTHLIHSNKTIIVSEEDSIENNRLKENWFSTSKRIDNGNNDSWEAYYNHNRFLEKKYLPHKLICYLPLLNIKNVKEFKKGLKNSLYGCDMCSYNLDEENINIYDDEDTYFTIIEFTLDEVINKSF